MNKNGKLFGKINIIDLLVLAAVLVLAVGIGARFVTSASENAKEKTSFEYVVKIEEVRKYTVDALLKKGIVSNPKTDEFIGEITDVTFEPSTKQHITAEGKAVNAEIPERYNCYVTVSAEGKESDMSYFVGSDIELSVGTTMTMATKYVNSSGKVISIEHK